MVVKVKDFPPDAWELLSPQMTSERRERMQTVAANRTNHIRLVIQDIRDPHNISACLRSAEAFGVLNVHVVTLKETFKPSTVGRGVHHWLNIHTHQSIEEATTALKAAGFLLAAGYPDQSAVKLQSIDVKKPIALIFGNEHDGVHDDWRPHIDLPFTIPMFGMVESLNISVSCAITLQTLVNKCRTELPESTFQLPAENSTGLLNRWACQQFPKYELQLSHLRKK